MQKKHQLAIGGLPALQLWPCQLLAHQLSWKDQEEMYQSPHQVAQRSCEWEKCEEFGRFDLLG